MKKLSDYSRLLKGIDTIEIAAKHKGLAKLGDEIINMVYSLGESVFISHPTGEKLNATALHESMKASGLRYLAKSRANAHSIADSAEAIVAYAFLQNKITTEELVTQIIIGFQKKPYPWLNNQMKRDAEISAITKLLVFIKSIYFTN